ncbi:MAG: GNAT family N-acetyltransferase [Balneolales bacterium]|nr:GNAT family N-acetyltransferase [Balneolales bacterium]
MFSFPQTDASLYAIDVDIVKLSLTELDHLRDLNVMLFKEERLITRYDQPDMIALLLKIDGIRAGFKIGYGREDGVFYSAKGGIMPAFRRKGYARKLMIHMMQQAWQAGYQTFRYDTFPKHYREMLLFGLKDGFEVTNTEYYARMNDFRIELSVSIPDYLLRVSEDRASDGAETQELH